MNWLVIRCARGKRQYYKVAPLVLQIRRAQRVIFGEEYATKSHLQLSRCDPVHRLLAMAWPELPTRHCIGLRDPVPHSEHPQFASATYGGR